MTDHPGTMLELYLDAARTFAIAGSILVAAREAARVGPVPPELDAALAASAAAISADVHELATREAAAWRAIAALEDAGRPARA